MDSYLAVLSYGFIKKFNHFLPSILNNRARLLKIVIEEMHLLVQQVSEICICDSWYIDVNYTHNKSVNNAN